MEIGPASLKAAAQLELNTRGTSASVTRYKYDFNQNKVSTEKETASIAPRTFRIFAAGKAEISSLARVSGVFEFNAQNTPAGTTLLAYVNASAYFGPFDVDLLKLDITGLFYWQGTDFAMRVDATVDVAVPGISLDVNLDLAMNTSGRDITYVVPESMRALTDKTSFTVPAGPPKFDGSHGAPGFYAVAMGTGSLELLSLVEIQGQFRFEITTTRVDLFVGATINLGPFGSAGLSGNLQFGAAGAAGALSIAIDGGLAGAGIKLQGQFQFEFNTGSAPATVRTIDVDKTTGEVNGFKDVELPGQSVHLVLGGKVLIANVFEVKGRVELAWVDSGFDMEFFGVLDLAGFNALTVEGGAQIRDGHFAAYTDIGAGNISIPMVTIQGDFELEVNTSSAPVTIGDRTIQPGTCRILIGATIRILGFELSGDVILGAENGVFGIELKDLKLNFFNFIDVNINGYVKSNGDFLFEGSIDIDVDMGPFKLYGGVGVRIANDSFKGWIYGGVDFAMDFGLFEIQFTLASLRANFEITQTSAATELEVTVLGFTAGGSVAWSWGPPPKIARKEGGTLRLNVGPDGHLRGEDYTDIINESYNIRPGKNAGEIVVSSMGVDETYTGITNISVPDFGDGNDFLYVDPKVELDVLVRGGAAADTLYLTGKGNVQAFGEAGNDKIYGGAGDDEIDGGSGDNRLYGMDGNDILVGLGGDDYIEGGAGNDRILAGAGDNEIYGGEPDKSMEDDDNDRIVVGDGSNLIHAGIGNDEILVGTGSNMIYAGDGDDVIDVADGNSIVYGGAGNDVITANSLTKFATIFGEDGNDTISVGTGNDRISGGGGDDTITSIGGDDQIDAGDGDDIITVTLQIDGSQLQVYGRSGTDSLDLTGPSNGQPLVMGAHTFAGSVLSLEFDNDIDVIRFNDTSASTILNTASPTSMNYGSIDFSVTGNQVTVDGASLRIPEGTLRIQTQTLTGDFQSELGALSVNAAGPTAGNIVVRELNSLELVGAGLQTSTGLVDVRLFGLDSTLELTEGRILAGGSGLPITIIADDIDFHSGENRVSGTGTLVIVSETSTRNYNIGSAGENYAGADRTAGTGDNGAMDLSMVDLAAIDDNFTKVTIGHRAPGVLMYVGDAQDQTEVKFTKEARVVNSALRNPTLFLADRINVVGAVEAPNDLLRLESRLVEIQSRNIHVPMGIPDSGLTGSQVELLVGEQLQVSGWIKAASLIDIDVTSTSGQGSLAGFSDGINSINTDITALLQTTGAASIIDIDAVGTVRNAGTIDAQGTGSKLTINSNLAVRNLEGGILNAPGAGSSITATGGTWLWIDSGSAVMAGVRFNVVGSTPIPEILGQNSTITLTSPSEMWLAGSVTASSTMTLNAGLKNFSHQEYFDTLPGRVLASTQPLTDRITSLKQLTFPEDLRPVFANAKLNLTSTVTVTQLKADSRWLATDDAGHRYVLYLFDPDGNGTPDELRVLQPHYLTGQRGFSFLVTGTLTVMQPDRTISLTAADDVIVRGNFNLPGAESDLTLQSDRWIYWEGSADISGDARLFGGLKLDGTDLGGFGIGGSSVYIADTSLVNTRGAGTSITIRGSRDVDITGPVVAGGVIGESGITWSGPDSTVVITAGQQVLVDSAVAAAKSVTITGGVAAADDNRLSVHVTTVGGASAAGLTSDNSGGTVTLQGPTDLQLTGNILSGGTMQQQFNAQGERIGESYTWSPEKSRIVLNFGGQAWIGGQAFTADGQLRETGGYLRTSDSISIIGGENPAGVGVRISAASEVMAVNPAASISIDSTGDTEILGFVLSGGTIERVFDTSGQYLGRRASTAGGDSTLRIEADNQIMIGLDVKAGKRIDLIGGADPVDPDRLWSGSGIVLQGSVQMSTWRPDSQINLNAPGPITILAPAYAHQIVADAFPARADGKLTSTVTLNLWVDKIDFEIEAAVTIPASVTADNTAIQDLLADIQKAINEAQWTVTQSDNSSHPTGSTWTPDPDDPDLVASLRNSQITLRSAYPHRLLNTSQNAALLGWTQTSADIDSSVPYVLYAPMTNSVVNIGAPTGPNGKLYIGGKVLAHSAINLFSGASDPGSNDDTQWVDLEVTGLLETLSGSITLSPNARTVLRGDVIARGATSDVIITATESIELRGSLEAGRNVTVSAGSVVRPGTESIRTLGTSEIRTLIGGNIRISGVNNVVIDSIVGPGSSNLSLVELQSTTGDLLIAEASGRIETSAKIDFLGNNVEIAGVVKSSASTPSLTDYEIRIDISGQVLLHSDFNLAGSLLVDAADITIYNQNLIVSGPDQRLTFRAANSLTLGRTETLPNGKLQQLGAVISAPDLQFNVDGLLTVNAGSAIFGAKQSATLLINADDMLLIGTLYGGAAPGESAKPIWLPAGALTLDLSGSLTMGGPGVNSQGNLTNTGGNLIATGALLIKTGDVVAISDTSSIKADPSGEQSIETAASGNLRLEVGTDLQLNGFLQSMGPASLLSISAGSQARINGLVEAQSLITIAAGTDVSGVGILVMPLILKTNSNGRLIDENGRLIDTDGWLINSFGQFVNEAGEVIEVPPGSPVAGGQPVRLSGGEIRTGLGGTISLTA
ncbi:MAG: hypothetical protein ACK5TX_02260, partial [Planctomyces sp.]